jgi:hypothetical protein
MSEQSESMTMKQAGILASFFPTQFQCTLVHKVFLDPCKPKQAREADATIVEMKDSFWNLQPVRWRSDIKRKAACLKWLVTSDFPNINNVRMPSTGTLTGTLSV